MSGAMKPQPWPVLDVIKTGYGEGLSSAVYIHGFGENGADIAEFAQRTVPPDHRAFIPTLRAHGDQPRPDWGYSPADFAADIQRTFTGIYRHMVVGYSFGAIVASAYTALIGPDRVTALVIIDQAFERRPDRVEADEWAEASYMKWQYDYRHHITSAARLGIPVLLVFGAGSEVVTDGEKRFWQAAREPGLKVEVVPGTHVDLVRGEFNAVAVTRAFLAHAAAHGGKTEL